MAVEDHDLLAVEHEAGRRALGAAGDGWRRGACLRRAPARQASAGGERGQCARSLRVAAAERDGAPAEQRRQPRQRRQRAAELGHRQAQLGIAERAAAELLADRDAGEAQLGPLQPHVAAEADGVAAVAQRAEVRDGRRSRAHFAPSPVADRRCHSSSLLHRQELASNHADRHHCGRDDDTLHCVSFSSVAEAEARRAMMLSWISDVPPSMVLARERSHSRVCCSSPALKPVAFPAEPV